MPATTKTYKTLQGAETAAAKHEGVRPLLIEDAQMAEELGYGDSTVGLYVLCSEEHYKVAEDLEEMLGVVNPSVVLNADGEPMTEDEKERLEEFLQLGSEEAENLSHDELDSEGRTPDQAKAEVEALRTRQAELKAELADINQRLATQTTVVQFKSNVIKPVQLVREVYVRHLLAAEGRDPEKLVRKDIINELVQEGVAPNTAKTQYQILRQKAMAGTLLDEVDERDAE